MKSIKICIVTFHRAINYGAVWQCYALTSFLKLKGFEVSVIDYFPDFLRRYHNRLPKKPYNFFLKLFIIPKFKKFVKKNLPLTVCYKNQTELRKSFPNVDVYICGSDQIWNKDIVGDSLSVFLLDFVPTNKVKISYAASIGGKMIDEKYHQVYIENLKTFTAVSVREKLAQNEIHKLIKIRPELVLDPTLLFDKYFYKNEISQRFKNKNYILIIDLNKDALLKECAMYIQKITKLPIINISGSYYKYAKNPIALSPEDWISSICYAKYVCVNSFHGLSFSIIFEKKFFYINNEIKEKNNRALDLLDILGLNSRYINNPADIDINSSIDYKEANLLKENYIINSQNFLLNAFIKNE